MIDIPQEIPTQIRDLAEKNVEQAREAFLGFIGAAQKVTTGATETLPLGAKEAMTKAMSFTEENIKAVFDLAQKLIHAKDVQEILTLQTEFATSQLTAMQKQAMELGTVLQEAIASGIKK
jgi:phasin